MEKMKTIKELLEIQEKIYILEKMLNDKGLKDIDINDNNKKVLQKK